MNIGYQTDILKYSLVIFCCCPQLNLYYQCGVLVAALIIGLASVYLGLGENEVVSAFSEFSTKTQK